jgi:hypothetical protein
MDKIFKKVIHNITEINTETENMAFNFSKRNETV